MKRLVISIIYSVACFAFTANANEDSSKIVINVSPDNYSLSLDPVGLGTTLYKNSTGEYHVYTNDEFVIVKNTINFALHRADDAKNFVFYKKNGIDVENWNDGADVSSEVRVGINQGFTDVKYKIGKDASNFTKYLFLHTFKTDAQEDLNLKIKSVKGDSILALKNDTVKLTAADSSGIKVSFKIDKRFVFKGIKINEKYVENVDLDTTSFFYIDDKTKPISDSLLRVGANMISIVYVGLDGNGNLSQEHTLPFIVFKESTDNPSYIIWSEILRCTLLGIMLLIIVLFRKKLKSLFVRNTNDNSDRNTSQGEDTKASDTTEFTPADSIQTAPVSAESTPKPEGILESYEKTINSLKGQNADLLAKLNLKTNEYIKLETDFSQLQSKYSQLEARDCSKLESDKQLIDSLKTQISKLEEDKNTLSIEKEKLSGQKAKLNIKLKDTTEKLAKEQNEKDKAVRDAREKERALYNKLKSNYEKSINQLKKDHSVEVKKLNEGHETELKNLRETHEAEVKALQEDNAKLKESANNGKDILKTLYSNALEEAEKLIAKCVNDADANSSVYAKLEEILTIVNNFTSFKDECLQKINSDEPINDVVESIKIKFVENLEYAMSWCNILARVYAYSQVDEMSEMFGYYNKYKVDIENAYLSMKYFGILFGVKICLPRLFQDKFDSEKYEVKNTNLVLPTLYPEYVRLCTPKAIYDMSVVGFTIGDEVSKPKVVYHAE